MEAFLNDNFGFVWRLFEKGCLGNVMNYAGNRFVGLTGLKSQPLKPPSYLPQFGAGEPWDVYISKNQVLSRLVVETLGSDPWILIFARNKYERYEKLFTTLCWLIVGLALPIGTQIGFRNWQNKLIRQKYHLPEKLSPLAVDFELLDRSRTSDAAFVRELQRFTKKAGESVQFSNTEIKELLPKVKALRNRLLHTKVGVIMFLDLVFMGINGQVANWGKNIITKRLTGSESFSGSRKYADKAYQEKNNQHYQKSKNSRLIGSLAAGVFGVVAFPLLFYGMLKSKQPVGKGFLGQLKKMTPAFNYTDAVYMSRWLIAWHGFFNFVAPGWFAARDFNEFREHTTRNIALYFFFFFGDGIIGGLLGKAMQNKVKDIALFTNKKLGPIRIPWMVPPHQIQEQLKQNPTLKAETKALITKLTRLNFWASIVATALGLGVSTTLVNNWYTKRRVLKEQRAMAQQKQQVEAHLAPISQRYSFEQFVYTLPALRLNAG